MDLTDVPHPTEYGNLALKWTVHKFLKLKAMDMLGNMHSYLPHSLL